ncbi:MAG: hypothetical protein HS100_07235 [Anaerolineales bacterium]|nr:hypothetical protein [Anaerolineales bacterium]
MKYFLRAALLFVLLVPSSCMSGKINLVIIGGGFAGNNIPQLYEAAIEERMGVEANTFTWIRVNEKPDGFLENMRVNPELREAVADADIILLNVSPNWSNSAELRYTLDSCGGKDNQDCLRETLVKTKCEWKGIMDSFAELRASQPVVFQVVLWSDWVFHVSYGGDATREQVSVMASYFTRFQEFQATTPGVQIVTVFSKTYEELPPEFFKTDGSHQFSEEGSRAAVELILSPGLEPSQPGIPELTEANADCGSISQ